MRKKYPIHLTVLFITFAIYSCKPHHISQSDNGKNIDQRLLGKWGGSEEDNQVSGVKKEWVMTRKADGTFSLDFKIVQNGNVDNWTEEGIWWVENEKFFEYHEDSGKTDVYEYEVLNKDEIKFKAVSIGVNLDNPDYTFIDTRLN